MKLPIWFWIFFVPLCLVQWSVGLWVESVTNTASQAFLTIIVLSFVLYPTFSFISISRFQKNDHLSSSTKNLGKAILLIGFMTNPAVLQIFKQIF